MGQGSPWRMQCIHVEKTSTSHSYPYAFGWNGNGGWSRRARQSMQENDCM